MCFAAWLFRLNFKMSAFSRLSDYKDMVLGKLSCPQDDSTADNAG